MAEFFALLAAIGFAVFHILIRQGLATSSAITGSFISLSIILAAMFLRKMEAVTSQVVLGGVGSVIGSILVVTA